VLKVKNYPDFLRCFTVDEGFFLKCVYHSIKVKTKKTVYIAEFSHQIIRFTLLGKFGIKLPEEKTKACGRK
jgi:hypothetical protein